MMTLVKLFVAFFKVGLFSFGGGYAMLPLIYQVVNQVGTMTHESFAELVALSQVSPGPIAVNAATYSGFEVAGITGSIVATIGCIIPEFVLVMLVVVFLEKFKQNKIMEGVFAGIRPATCGLLAAAVIFIAKDNIVKEWSLAQIKANFTGYFNLIPILFFLCTILLAGKFKMGSIKIIVILGVAGALLYGFVLY